jgi:uncharacterized protein YprB with RNaseH-like and TPR domain
VSLGSQDRFARLAALKPARRAASFGAPATALPPASDELAELLGAQIERNRYGEYLAARRWFAEPAEFEPAADALRLLLPKSPGQIAGTAAASREISDSASWLFLDTETTGLAGGTGTYAFLVGLAWWDAGGLQVEQLFMRDHSEEHAVLAALAKRLRERRVLVTFNGKSFDWPLVETRFRMTRQIEPVAPRAHLDLLHPARQVWRPRLGSVRLPELEREILGLARGPDIASELIPQVYFDFLRGAGARALALVFRHNQMDLCGLATLAAHLSALLAAPEEAPADPLDLYGLSRLLTRRGALGKAERLCERALEAGLPETVDRAARRELARLAKRQRDFPRANQLWESLAKLVRRRGAVAATLAPQIPAQARVPVPLMGCTARRSLHAAGALGGAAGELDAALEACEQLAIHYEHRAREAERALEFTRAALVALADPRLGGPLDSGRLRRWHARFEHRLARLSRRSSLERLPLR